MGSLARALRVRLGRGAAASAAAAAACGAVIAACGTAHVALTPARDATGVDTTAVGTTAVAASCAGLSAAQQLAGAHLVFVGRMLPGPTARLGGRRVLASPARARVARYLKGHGPGIVKVETAVAITHRGVTVSEDGIMPRAGQRWKIYTDSRRQPFDTATCAGSRPIGGTKH